MNGLVLVTGGDGFIGRHLVARLLKEGCQVRVLDKAFHQAPNDGAERIEADILDATLVHSAMGGVSTVYHLAAITSLWIPDENLYHSVNVEGTRTVLQAAIAAKSSHFIHCSSFVTTISGPRNQRTITEADVANPPALFGAYARSKRRAERLVLDTSDIIHTTVVMPSAPLGPGDHHLTAPTGFIRDLVNGKIPATLDQIMNFVDVELLAEAMIAAPEAGPSGERYLLSGQNLPMPTLLKMMSEITGLAMPQRKVPYGLAVLASLVEEKIISRILARPPKAPYPGVRMAGRKLSFDNTKSIAALDINLNPIDDALNETLLWLQREGHLTRSLPAYDTV